MLDKAPPKADSSSMAQKSTKQPPKISDSLRTAIREADCTRYAIHKATGIDQAVLTKFLQGERGISLSTIDLLAEFLGLELTKRKG